MGALCTYTHTQCSLLISKLHLTFRATDIRFENFKMDPTLLWQGEIRFYMLLGMGQDLRVGTKLYIFL